MIQQLVNAEINGFHTIRYGNGDDNTLGSITRVHRTKLLLRFPILVVYVPAEHFLVLVLDESKSS